MGGYIYPLRRVAKPLQYLDTAFLGLLSPTRLRPADPKLTFVYD
jgi:hypothetical protein